MNASQFRTLIVIGLSLQNDEIEFNASSYVIRYKYYAHLKELTRNDSFTMLRLYYITNHAWTSQT